MRLTPKSRLSLHGLRRRTLSLSAVQGPLHPELDEKTLPHYFASEILQQYSSRPALTCRREGAYSLGGPKLNNLNVDTHLAWDFAEFDRAINACARGLLEMGVVKGDRVGVLMGNNSAYAILQWACASIGAIVTTINPAYRVGELVNVLNLVGVKHLVVVPRIRTSHYIQLLTDKFPSLKHSAPGNIQEEGLPSLRNIIVVDNEEVHREELSKLDIKTLIDWREVLMWREDNGSMNRRYKDITESLHNDDIANIQFTSGTTGSPKAVTLTHRNLLNNSLSIGRRMHLTERDVVCEPFRPAMYLPCSTVLMRNLAAWVHGACIVYPSAIFDPPAIVDSIAAERCTALHGVPTHFLGVLKEIEARREQGEEADTRTLRTGIAAGSPIPIQLMRRLISEMNLKELTNAYGMTETSPVSFQTVPEDPLMKRVETVGRILPHVKAKIIDSEGKTVPVSTPGELCVSGYLVQKGYWNDEEQTRSVMQKDDSGVLWMHTGDQGILDEDGYLRIVGRIKDIIIRGGENLFPVQIENALTTHPGVLEAAAISVPNEKYGEVVGVWIVRAEGYESETLGATQIRALVSDMMNPQNAPAWVWFTEELPKTASGKVMKHVLRERGRILARDGTGRTT